MPSAPVLPVLTGGAEVQHGLHDRVDLGARYTVHLGWVHRIGPTVRLRLVGSDRFAWALDTAPTVALAGAGDAGGIDLGGDASTRAVAVASWLRDARVWTVEAGVLGQWVIFEHLDGKGFVEAHPWLASGQVALGHRWRHRRDDVLQLRLELAIPRRHDPFSVLGVIPRLTLGGRLR